MKSTTRAIIGGVIWATFSLWKVPSWQHDAWAHAMLLFAALVLLPLALDLFHDEDEGPSAARLFHWVALGQLPAAALLTLSCALAPGLFAGTLALPWLALTVVLANIGLLRILHEGWGRQLDRLCADVALIFVMVGGGWVLADRLDFRPLNFPAPIVTLTAVHFHYAGLLLPLFAGLAQRRMPPFTHFAPRVALGVTLGVPAVAIGITVTQLGGSPVIEAGTGWGLALSGMGVAILQVRLATERVGSPLARALLGISGVALFFGMLLAGIYAMRAFSAPLPWLGLPWMRALHGTANAIGFAFCGVLGWRLVK
jgi:hypothetical protein